MICNDNLLNINMYTYLIMTYMYVIPLKMHYYRILFYAIE